MGSVRLGSVTPNNVSPPKSIYNLNALLPTHPPMYFRYARSYLFLAVLITFVSGCVVYSHGPAVIGSMLFLKCITMLVGWAVLRRRHSKDIFFYQNIGYGEPRLLAVTGAIDLGVWLISITTLVILYF